MICTVSVFHTRSFDMLDNLQCKAYLQLGELALSSASLLGGKVAGLNGLRQIQLAAFKHLVGRLELPLQIHHLHAVHWMVRTNALTAYPQCAVQCSATGSAWWACMLCCLPSVSPPEWPPRCSALNGGGRHVGRLDTVCCAVNPDSFELSVLKCLVSCT